MKNKLIPVTQVPEVALERIQTLVEDGGIEFSPYSLGAWSPSKYKTLDKCPLKFFLDYILKVAVLEEDAKTDDAALKHIGTAAHSVLELAVQGMGVEEAYEKAKELHFKDVTEEHWFKVDDLRPNIIDFLTRLREFKAANKVAHIYPELKLAVDRNWKAVPFFSKKAYFRGVVDLPMLMENGDIVILDHKHGGNPEFGLRNYQEQLDSYKALFHFGKKKVTGAASGIHFIKAGDIILGRRVSSSYIEQIPNKIQVFIEGSIDHVKEAGCFKYQRNSLCTYCPYQPICHNGKRGTANLLQPIIEESKVLLNERNNARSSKTECPGTSQGPEGETPSGTTESTPPWE